MELTETQQRCVSTTHAHVASSPHPPPTHPHDRPHLGDTKILVRIFPRDRRSSRMDRDRLTAYLDEPFGPTSPQYHRPAVTFSRSHPRIHPRQRNFYGNHRLDHRAHGTGSLDDGHPRFPGMGDCSGCIGIRELGDENDSLTQPFLTPRNSSAPCPLPPRKEGGAHSEK